MLFVLTHHLRRYYLIGWLKFVQAVNVSVIPIRLRDGNAPKVEGTDTQMQLLDEQEYPIRPNLSMSARNYLTSLGIELGTDVGNATLIWMHALAIGYSPAYLSENADGIRKDWPRTPLPGTKPLVSARRHESTIGRFVKQEL